MNPLIRAATAVVFAGAVGGSALAQDGPRIDGPRVRAGTLSCDVSPGIGLIIASERQVSCVFTPARRAPRQAYGGAIRKFGLDIGATGGGRMVWAVYAPGMPRMGALAGHYGGPGAEATVGAGGGVNFLSGGYRGAITLQPLSGGQVGFNLAGGVNDLELHPAR